MITLLKLGGSLITDKNIPHTARRDVICRLAKEIRTIWGPSKEPLLIGHGSGSFGHIPAKRYGTRLGVHTEIDWNGFAEVHAEASDLNHIFTKIFRDEGLPVLSFVPMPSVRCSDGKITYWDTAFIEECFRNHLIPIVFGDTVFDDIRGGTILSTEDLFLHLCETFQGSKQILLAGLEEGVWKDYPNNAELISFISAKESDNSDYIKSSASPDVTGGMAEKVRLMKKIIKEEKAESALIFSGETPGNLSRVLSGEIIGTFIK